MNGGYGLHTQEENAEIRKGVKKDSDTAQEKKLEENGL